jgi:hypothetical protein
MILIYAIVVYKKSMGIQIKLDRTFWSLVALGFSIILFSRPLKRPRGHIIADIWWKNG